MADESRDFWEAHGQHDGVVGHNAFRDSGRIDSLFLVSPSGHSVDFVPSDCCRSWDRHGWWMTMRVLMSAVDLALDSSVRPAGLDGSEHSGNPVRWSVDDALRLPFLENENVDLGSDPVVHSSAVFGLDWVSYEVSKDFVYDSV